MSLRSLLPWFLWCTGAAASLSAQPQQQQQQQQNQQQQPQQPGAQFTIPAGEITPDQLLLLAARHLHWNILMPRPSGLPPFVFQEAVRTDAAGCLQLVEDRLSERHLVLVPVDPQLRIYRVVSLRGPQATAAAAAAVFVRPGEVRAGSRRMVITLVPLANADAEPVAKELGGKVVPGEVLQLRAMPAPNRRAVLLSGQEDQVAAAITRARELDQPKADTALPAATELEARLTALEQQLADLEQQVQAIKQGR